MKTTKLVIGIISCVLFIIIMFQSCAASLVESMGSSDSTSGAAGLIAAIFLVAGGITSIASHRNAGGKGTIVAAILYFIAALTALTDNGVFEDLAVWGSVCVAFGIAHVIFYIVDKKQKAHMQ